MVAPPRARAFEPRHRRRNPTASGFSIPAQPTDSDLVKKDPDHSFDPGRMPSREFVGGMRTRDLEA
jgi:hypothetical protein